MERSHPRVAVIGECTIDEYRPSGVTTVGGIALNFAVHAARAGAQVSLFSRAGRDGFDMITAALARERVDAHIALDASQPTARQLIDLAPDGERIFPPGGYTYGAMTGWLPDPAPMHLGRFEALACPVYRQAQPLFEHVLAHPFAGARFADFTDLGDVGRDVAFVARHAKQLTAAFVGADDGLREPLRAVSQRVPATIVLTLGARGSVAFVNGSAIEQPAIAVPRVVDTTGCGDAFQAGYVVSWLRHHDVARALRAGAECAAQVAQHQGAF